MIIDKNVFYKCLYKYQTLNPLMTINKAPQTKISTSLEYTYHKQQLLMALLPLTSSQARPPQKAFFFFITFLEPTIEQLSPLLTGHQWKRRQLSGNIILKSFFVFFTPMSNFWIFFLSSIDNFWGELTKEKKKKKPLAIVKPERKRKATKPSATIACGKYTPNPPKPWSVGPHPLSSKWQIQLYNSNKAKKRKYKAYTRRLIRNIALSAKKQKMLRNGVVSISWGRNAKEKEKCSPHY